MPGVFSPNTVDAAMEPETIPRLLAREVSAATTVMDPITDTEADSSSETAELPESPADARGDELHVSAADAGEVPRDVDRY